MRRGANLPPLTARHGLSVIELLVCLGVLLMLGALTFPAIQAVRESARDSSCLNHLRQLAVATHEHEAMHRVFPPTSVNSVHPDATYHAVSPHRSLILILEPTTRADISFDDPTTPLWTSHSEQRYLYPGHRQLSKIPFDVFLCPSDRSPLMGTNYRANMGTSVRLATYTDSTEWGAFTHAKVTRTAAFLDGLAHTVLYCERNRGDDNESVYDPFLDIFATGDAVQETAALSVHCRSRASLHPPWHFSQLGRSWLLGGWLNTWYNHVHGPNSSIPDCDQGPCCVDGGESVIAARSLHPGHVNLARADGSVGSANEAMDLHVWQALGTRSGREGVSPPP
jgi:hypothetical protein